MTDNNRRVITMHREKETKNKVRFKIGDVPELSQYPIIDTIYVDKQWVGNSTQLLISIEHKE